MSRDYLSRFVFAQLLLIAAFIGCGATSMELDIEILPPTDSAGQLPFLGRGGGNPTLPSDDNAFLKADELANEIPPAPEDFENGEPLYKDLSLQEAIRIGIENSKIIRDLGGNTLRNPDAVRSVFDPAITFTDPQLGEEAALSAFDARFFTQAFFEKNDRVVNNQFLATDGVLVQDLGDIRMGISKRTASGGLYTVSSIQEYDFNNSIGNRFGNPSSSWNSLLQGELRQSLLRGRDAIFNRIAGPNVEDGVFNGVLIAKSRTDISAAEFKEAVRDFIADVENAYWDLYYAYRDLEAKTAARDNALESWRRIKALGNEKKAGGEADKEGQAREQYFRFEAEVNDSLYGRVTDATRTSNGAAGGTFRPVPGVRIAERRLRLLIGMAANGQTLLRPSQDPVLAPVVFDWAGSVQQAYTNRVEIFRQHQRIKQARMRVLAAKSAIQPQLDFVGRYTFRGFGHSLIGDHDVSPTSSAAENLFDNENHEWQMGVDLNIPIGYRRAHAALRHNQNRLARERQMLKEQKRQIVNDLSDAMQDVKRARKSFELQYNRLDSAISQLAAVQETNRQKKAPFNLVLEAQRRVLEAQIEYYRTQVEYTLAIRNVHFEKGTLFDYMAVHFVGDNLTDGIGQDDIRLSNSATIARDSFVISPQPASMPSRELMPGIEPEYQSTLPAFQPLLQDSNDAPVEIQWETIEPILPDAEAPQSPPMVPLNDQTLQPQPSVDTVQTHLAPISFEQPDRAVRPPSHNVVEIPLSDRTDSSNVVSTSEPTFGSFSDAPTTEKAGDSGVNLSFSDGSQSSVRGSGQPER